MRPKKNAAKAIQYVVLMAAVASGVVGIERSGAEQHREHGDDEDGCAEHDRQGEPVAAQDVEVATGQHDPLGHRPGTIGEPAGGRPGGRVRWCRCHGARVVWRSATTRVASGGRCRRGARRRSARRACVGDPTKTTPPAATTTMRSQARRSSVLWVVSTIVVPWSARRRSVPMRFAAVDGSSPDVGSSRKKARGRVRSSTAMLVRLRWPPLRSPTAWSPGSRGRVGRACRPRRGRSRRPASRSACGAGRRSGGWRRRAGRGGSDRPAGRSRGGGAGSARRCARRRCGRCRWSGGGRRRWRRAGSTCRHRWRR